MHRIYTTIKQVSATEMSSVEAIAKGYRVDENSLQIEGYEITYEDGYKSWCPKEVFLKNAIISAPDYTYTVPHSNNYPDYIKRMINEFNELKEKLIKLSEFINGNKFKELSAYQQHMLIMQFKFMDGYINVLGTRLYSETTLDKTAKE